MFKVSAPGSLMLLGEYAVLHHHHALVCAIDKRIQVTLTPRVDEKIIIESALGHYETTLSHLEKTAPFQFVLAALHSLRKSLPQGCHIQIESEFSSVVGFASSAAVTVATVKALSEWLKLTLSPSQLIQLARDIVRDVQGSGSGADVAACVLGGVVLYRPTPFLAEKLEFICPITVVYSGSKTPTPIAIQHVHERFSTCPDIFSKLMETINECTLAGVDAFRIKDWSQLGKMMNIQQGLMDALGVNNKIMSDIITILRQQPQILGTKISGSGLGDCVVALGECTLDQGELSEMKVNMTKEGVYCEKI